MDSDENKRRKMESNRESARRSRAKKQKELDDLSNDVRALEIEIGESNEKIRVYTELLANMLSANEALRALALEYSNRMYSLNKAAGMPLRSQILMQPWLPSFSTVPIIPAADLIDGLLLLVGVALIGFLIAYSNF
ncbi:bZIP transcription factor 53-like [Hibiscus syriacus]|uniref:bZIP transcription factor 53-like n=1 Tax=Hibiscus syriacus TaxID=106335 RepID=UPI001923EF87|nr:bZIP transcription factor 53-like [Hibiscus syriacus]